MLSFWFEVRFVRFFYGKEFWIYIFLIVALVGRERVNFVFSDDWVYEDIEERVDVLWEIILGKISNLIEKNRLRILEIVDERVNLSGL